jgi:hypothetical protein
VGLNRAALLHLPSFCIWFLAFGGLALIKSSAQEHAFEVRDSIEMVRFSDPSELVPGSTATYSPDGIYFTCTTTRGVVRSNRVESTIWVFSAVEAKRYLASRGALTRPPPVRVASIATRVSMDAVVPYAPVIEDVRWTPDSRYLLFLAHTGQGTKRLYRASILTHKVELLSRPNQDVQRYNAEAGTIVYTTSRPQPATLKGRELEWDPGAVIGTGVSLSAFLFKLKSADPGNCDLWTYRNQRSVRLQGLNSCWTDTVSLHLDPLSLSPDGRFLAWLYHVQSLPMAWNELKPKPGFADSESENGGKQKRGFNPQDVRQYGIFDIRSGRIATLVDAPYAGSWGYFGLSYAAWSPDGRRLAITDVLLPTPRGRDNSPGSASQPCLLAVVTKSSGEIRCVTSTPPERDAADFGPYHLNRVRWAENGQDLVVWFRNTKMIKLVRYTEENERWQTIEERIVDTMEIADSSNSNLPTISIKQSFDDGPPALWISDAGLPGLELWDPNPQFSHMIFGKASLYQWTDKSGEHWTGGLVLPVGYRAGEKYPLVIQTHGVWDKMFMTDGCFPTAMAARPLASAGFVVLQIGSVDPVLHPGTPTEADEATVGIDGAIDKLTSDGLIDTNRIGITGFSRTSWYVETELVKHPHRFAAAIIADGIDEGYLQYLLFGDGNEDLRKESERINMGPPFGVNLSRWLESSATFHLDRIATPVRVEAHGPESLLGEWQIYASLRLEHKPVDLIYFLGEQHILQNPADRLASQQGAVDWYRFWLKGEEDPGPRKRSQYRRWETLRAECDLEGAHNLKP